VTRGYALGWFVPPAATRAGTLRRGVPTIPIYNARLAYF